MSTYQQQVNCSAEELDIDFWKSPRGVGVPDDELDFLLLPDAVEALATFDVARQVHAHQRQQQAQGQPITRALIVTMGGMLPGVLLHDHLVEGREPTVPAIEFGTIGVSLYQGPGVRHEEPRVVHGISVPVSGQSVLVIDDLCDYGATMQFLTQYIRDSGAARVLSLVLYMKPVAMQTISADFWFGELPQNTWLITPRERVETMLKRVPVWRQRGASQQECEQRLVELIGYPQALVDYYLPRAYG